MEEHTRNKIMAAIIGIVMLASMAGFAGLQLMGRSSQEIGDDQTVQIPTVVYRDLDRGEVLYILQNGMVLMQYIYEEDCESCLEDKQLLENVANRYQGYMVLQAVVGNDTSLRMTGIGGSVTEIEDDVTEELITDKFCTISPVKPRECLLREFE
ncbi:MAG: hypothetical protein ABIH52_00805 [Candidatus Aenigmatarchaeota archaeon]|nr:hypothetical protein [Nanoarchaeota archaeon]